MQVWPGPTVTCRRRQLRISGHVTCFGADDEIQGTLPYP